MIQEARASRIPINPEGTVGVGVLDGSYDDTLSADAIRSEAQEYLNRSGLVTSPMPYKGMGSATGDAIAAIGTALVTEVLIHVLVAARQFLSSLSERRLERKLGAHRKGCYVQLGDRRGNDRDAVQLLQMLPGLREHLSQAYPNRNYSFVVFSAMPSIKFVQIILRDYEPLGRTVKQMARIILRLPASDFAGLYLQPGPFGSMRIAYNVV